MARINANDEEVFRDSIEALVKVVTHQGMVLKDLFGSRGGFRSVSKLAAHSCSTQKQP
jgi:hypothetical protein